MGIGIPLLQGVQVEIPEIENSTMHDRQTEILEEVAYIIPGCILNNISYGSFCIIPFSCHLLTLLQQPQLVYFSYKRQLVSIDPEVQRLLAFVFNASLGFFKCLGFTMGISILLLVHYRTLKFRGNSGKRIQLTNLEKRLIWFTIVIFPIAVTDWSILAWAAIVYDPWMKRVTENILCTRNFTNTTLIDNQYCNSIASYEELIPSFLFVVQNLLSRIGLLPELLLTFPDGTVVTLKKYARKIFKKINIC